MDRESSDQESMRAEVQGVGVCLKEIAKRGRELGPLHKSTILQIPLYSGFQNSF